MATEETSPLGASRCKRQWLLRQEGPCQETQTPVVREPEDRGQAGRRASTAGRRGSGADTTPRPHHGCSRAALHAQILRGAPRPPSWRHGVASDRPSPSGACIPAAKDVGRASGTSAAGTAGCLAGPCREVRRSTAQNGAPLCAGPEPSEFPGPTRREEGVVCQPWGTLTWTPGALLAPPGHYVLSQLSPVQIPLKRAPSGKGSVWPPPRPFDLSCSLGLTPPPLPF